MAGVVVQEQGQKKGLGLSQIKGQVTGKAQDWGEQWAAGLLRRTAALQGVMGNGAPSAHRRTAGVSGDE